MISTTLLAACAIHFTILGNQVLPQQEAAGIARRFDVIVAITQKQGAVLEVQAKMLSLKEALALEPRRLEQFITLATIPCERLTNPGA